LGRLWILDEERLKIHFIDVIGRDEHAWKSIQTDDGNEEEAPTG
jgi:hypothetical protein